jgi:hypothetical protein
MEIPDKGLAVSICQFVGRSYVIENHSSLYLHQNRYTHPGIGIHFLHALLQHQAAYGC